MPENANVSQAKSTSPIDIIPVSQPVPMIAVNNDSSISGEEEQLNGKEEDTNGHEEGVVKRMKGQLRRILKRHSGYGRNTFDGGENSSPQQHYPTSDNNVYINGRRYQNYNSYYFFPNDETEMDRLLNNVCLKIEIMLSAINDVNPAISDLSFFLPLALFGEALFWVKLFSSCKRNTIHRNGAECILL